MRHFLLTLLAFICINSLFAQQQIYFPSFENKALSLVIQYLENNHNLVFSYKDDNIQNKFVESVAGNYELDSFVSNIFAQTNLEITYIDQTHILLTPKTIDTNAFFCAFLMDEQSLAPLPFANILVKENTIGAQSMENGYFQLEGIKASDTLLITYLGYKTLEVIIKDFNSGSCPNLYLNKQGINMPEVLVTVYLSDGIVKDDHGQKIIIEPNKLPALPGQAEPDVFHTVQLLPGIFSANETTSELNIRGGTPDQNLILYDGIPVYHSGHFFGMISAFNPYQVESIDVFRSGMSTEYGGRVSGVIDIHSKSRQPKKLELGLGINMTHMHVDMSIPIGKQSYLSVSTRRSFTDIVESPTFTSLARKVFQGTKFENESSSNDEDGTTNDFYFSDFNFKWVWTPGKNKFSLNLFSGFNNLDYSNQLPEFSAFSRDIVNLANYGTSLYWDRKWSNRFESSIRLTNSAYQFEYNIGFQPIERPDSSVISFNTTNDVDDIGFYWTNTWKIKDSDHVKFGYQFTNNALSLGLTEKNFDQINGDTLNFKHRIHTLFGEYHLALSELIHLDLGVRYQYQSEIDNYYFEPRIALNTTVNQFLKIKVSSSKQFQFVSQLVFLDLDDLSFGNQIWITANESIPVIESNQWTGGILFSKNSWKIDLEGYVKELAGITSLSNSFGTLPQQPFSKGNSRIRGLDVLIKKRINDNYRSWLSYTLSQAVYEFPDFNEPVFPASHDRRHNLQWVHLIEKNDWQFSVGWQFGSGLPYTPVTGVDTMINTNPFGIPIDTSYQINYDSQNSSRLSPYHRLDASIKYNFGNQKTFKGFLGLSLINIYNHKNILRQRFLLDDFDNNQSAELLGIEEQGLRFTPNLVLRMQW